MHNRHRISNTGNLQKKGGSLPHFNNQGELQMQKKIIALAIAAAFAAPVAMAADGVTVYGALDGGFRSVTSNGVTSNTYNSNRWGIKSSEDLGDGMKANVTLEGDIVTGTGEGKADTGTKNELFSRTATVGLEGGFGAVDLGRSYTVAYKVNDAIDPFAHKFITITSANLASGYTLTATDPKTITRYDNNISYTGKFGDVTVLAERTMGAATTDAGAATAAGVMYASGPVNVGVSYTKTKSTGANVDQDATHMQIGAGFNFGDGSVKVGYSSQENKESDGAGTLTVGSSAKGTAIWLGANYNVSQKIGVTAAYYKGTFAVTGADDETSSNIVAALTYSLSKRTLAYVELDRQTSNAGGGAADVGSAGYSLGLSTKF
jgi:predicted porin